jgi:hypothetical protein
MHGSTCFGCHGKGIVLSKRGIVAANAFDAERLRLCGVPVESITVGSRVLIDGRFRTIEEVTPGGGGSSTVDGVTTTFTSVSLWFTKVYADGKRVHHGHGVTTGGTVVRGNTPEEWDALLAFADTLPGALLNGVPSTATVVADAKAAKSAATRAATKARKAALQTEAVSQ